MIKYNNYKKNDNIIVKAGNITLVGAEVGVGDKSRHHRPVGRRDSYVESISQAKNQ